MIRRLCAIFLVSLLWSSWLGSGGAYAATARTVYVALGDSSTLGLGAEDSVHQSYPALLARHLAHGSRYFNFAAGCGTVSTALTDQEPQALKARPTLVTIWLGWADLLPGCGAPESSKTFSALYTRLLVDFQRVHARVFVGNLPDMRKVSLSSTPVPAHAADNFNHIISDVAKRHGAVVVDIHAATRSLWPHPELQSGGELNARGLSVLAGVWYRSMHQHGVL